MDTSVGGSGRGPDVAVALQALEVDATRWTAAARDLRGAAEVAAGQVLAEEAFSFAGREVAATYEALRGRTAALLREGAANFDAVATALRDSARAYAAQEAARAAELRGPR